MAVLSKIAAGQVALLALALCDASAACPTEPDALERSAFEAEKHFALMDDDAFESTWIALKDSISCLASPPNAAQSAAIHRVRALDAFRRGDSPEAIGALRAMLEADPNSSLSMEVAPPGHQLRLLFDEARLQPANSRAMLQVVPPCRAVVDGESRNDRPVDLPAIVVLQGMQGDVLWSGVLDPGHEFDVTCPEAERRSGKVGHRVWPFWTAAAGAAAVSGGLWSAAVLTNRQLVGIQQQIATRDNVDLSAEEIRQLGERRDNLLSATQISSLITAGLGVVSVGVTIRW